MRNDAASRLLRKPVVKMVFGTGNLRGTYFGFWLNKQTILRRVIAWVGSREPQRNSHVVVQSR